MTLLFHRLTGLLAGSLLLSVLAPAQENSQLILVRSTFASGGLSENIPLQLQSATTNFFAAPAPSSTLLTLYPGFLAPATDPVGLVTRDRIQRILLGQDSAPDLVAIDFAGNRDGRVDAADLVSAGNRQVP